MEEIWKDIPEYENWYQVSNLGRVRSLNRLIKYRQGFELEHKSKILKLTKTKTGYYQVSLCKNSREWKVNIHTLVSITFLGLSKNTRITHIDGNRLNNVFLNLKEVIKNEKKYKYKKYKDSYKKYYETHKNQAKVYYQKNKLRLREYENSQSVSERRHTNLIKRNFGLTKLDYDNLLNKQKGVCAICNQKETSKHQKGKLRKLSVDHCHITGKVRGLLCTKCNMSLGGFRDNIAILKIAVSYLEDNV